MRLEPKILERALRRGILLVSAGGLAYLAWRFGIARLPESSCSPLVALPAGSTLVLDERPRPLAPGDAVFFGGPGGLLYLGRVERVRGARPAGAQERELWITTDDPGCPGVGSQRLGWIPESSATARVLFALPW